MESTKILFLGESPVLPSSSAEILRLLARALELPGPGVELQQCALNHTLAVSQANWTIWPTESACHNDAPELARNDLNGEITYPKIVEAFQPDIVIAIGDIERLAHACVPATRRSHRLVLYLKLDNFPVPAAAGPSLRNADLVVTMSEFSREILLSTFPELSPKKVCVIYSPADTGRFVPVTQADQLELRDTLFPAWMPQNSFVLGWVGLNRWRKQVWLPYKVLHYLRSGKYLVCERCACVSLFDWDPLERKHSDETGRVLESRPGYKFDVCAHCGSGQVRQAEPLLDVFLWMHMPEDDPASAWSAEYLEWEYGVKRNEDLFYTEGYGIKAALAPEDMPTLYQLWDALLFLSGGEGFGMPCWEAMCTGLPVVYTNYSSHAEYLNAAGAGIGVDGILQPEKKTGYRRMIADVSKAILAVRTLYFNRALGRQMGENGRRYVQQFNMEAQARRWRELLKNEYLPVDNDGFLPLKSSPTSA